MKKVISLILVVAMVLAFVACGATQVSSDKYLVTYKGSGKKTVTVTVKGDFSKSAISLKVPEFTGGEKYFEGSITKQNEKRVVCEFRPLEAGFAIASIVIGTSGDDEDDVINVALKTQDSSHLFCEGVEINDINRFLVDEDAFKVINFSGGVGSLAIKLIDDHSWNAGENDLEAFDISAPDTEYIEGYCVFNVQSKKIGEYFLEFINRDALKQLLLHVNVTEVASEALSAEEGDTVFVPQLLDYSINDVSEDYVKRSSKYQDEYTALYNKFNSGISLPNNTRIDEIAVYSSKDSNVGMSLDDNLLDPNTVIPEEMDTLTAFLRIADGDDFYLTISSATTVKKEKSYIAELKDTIDEQELTYGDTTVYFIMTNMCDYAVWQGSDKNVGVITFMDEDKTIESDMEILNALFGAN